MPVTASERVLGRRRNGNNLQREWIARPAETDDEALAAVYDAADTVIGSFTLTANQTTTEEVAKGHWLVTPTYSPPDGSSFTENSKSFSMSFDISGATQRITHSRGTTRFPFNASTPSAATNAPDYKGAINVSVDGEVEGADIIIPTFSIQRTYQKTGSDVTTAYVLLLADTVGTVNNATWGGFAADELLLTGVSGTARLKNQNGSVDDPANRVWDITYRWEVSRTRTGISIGGITGITKKGWEYLWVLWQNTVDPNAKWLSKKAKGVYCEEVYPRTDYATNLGI